MGSDFRVMRFVGQWLWDTDCQQSEAGDRSQIEDQSFGMKWQIAQVFDVHQGIPVMTFVQFMAHWSVMPHHSS